VEHEDRVRVIEARAGAEGEDQQHRRRGEQQAADQVGHDRQVSNRRGALTEVRERGEAGDGHDDEAGDVGRKRAEDGGGLVQADLGDREIERGKHGGSDAGVDPHPNSLLSRRRAATTHWPMRPSSRVG
jgi:hypothetical protein